jgi:hypothetical protein
LHHHIEAAQHPLALGSRTIFIFVGGSKPHFTLPAFFPSTQSIRPADAGRWQKY